MDDVGFEIYETDPNYRASIDQPLISHLKGVDTASCYTVNEDLPPIDSLALSIGQQPWVQYLRMLSEQLLSDLSFLSTLQTDTYTKVINYAVNFLINEENTMKINEFIEIDEQEGERVTGLVLQLIEALAQYQTNHNDLPSHIKLLNLDKERREFLLEKLNDNLQQIRKAIFRPQLEDVTPLATLQWRLEIETASKNYRNDYRPNVLLNFRVKDEGRINNNLVNCDFANLKNLQSCLMDAMKLHRSARFRSARNSSV